MSQHGWGKRVHCAMDDNVGGGRGVPPSQQDCGSSEEDRVSSAPMTCILVVSVWRMVMFWPFVCPDGKHATECFGKVKAFRPILQGETNEGNNFIEEEECLIFWRCTSRKRDRTRYSGQLRDSTRSIHAQAIPASEKVSVRFHFSYSVSVITLPFT